MAAGGGRAWAGSVGSAAAGLGGAAAGAAAKGDGGGGQRPHGAAGRAAGQVARQGHHACSCIPRNLCCAMGAHLSVVCLVPFPALSCFRCFMLPPLATASLQLGILAAGWTSGAALFVSRRAFLHSDTYTLAALCERVTAGETGVLLGMRRFAGSGRPAPPSGFPATPHCCGTLRTLRSAFSCTDNRHARSPTPKAPAGAAML